ncbi:MAG: hypothetical protein K8L97_13075 [Anaerolineae bacterium]|nr:hypothetical protein [Anaerolineae bacterium]
MPTLNQLLDIEVSAGFWDAEAMGVLLWPAARTLALEKALAPDLKAPTPPAQGKRLKTLMRQWPKHLQTAKSLIFPQGDCSAVFFKPGVDRIHRYYYERLPRPLLIEASWNGQNDEADWSSGQAMLLEDTLKLWLYIQGHLKPLPADAARTIADFAAHVSDTLNLGKMRHSFADKMMVHVQRCRSLRPLLAKRVLPRLKSRMAFVHMSSYMGIVAPITKSLHDEGFSVVELQHGMVALTDRAHNFPALCFQSEHPARAYLPDIFLTFGDFWAENVRIPAQKVPIGFPLLAESVARLADIQANPQDILVISQWTISKQLVEVVAQAARMLPDYRFMYKLHPREAHLPFDALRGLPNVELVTSGNVHDWIARCGIVVGYNSTVVAETLAFTNKRLFILQNDDLPKGMGHEFADAAALVDAIGNPHVGYPAINPRNFWADNWQGRIDSFLSEYLT